MAMITNLASPEAKQNAAMNPDSFAAMFEDSLTHQDMRAGEVITAEVSIASSGLHLKDAVVDREDGHVKSSAA